MVHHPSSQTLLFMDGKNLAKRLIENDPTWDGWMDWPRDKDGWTEVLDRLMKTDEE